MDNFCNECKCKEYCAEYEYEATCQEIRSKYEEMVLSSAFKADSNNPQGV